jgi:hypothetical protein
MEDCNMKYEFDVDDTFEAAIPAGTMVRAYLTLRPCECAVWVDDSPTEGKEPGWLWNFNVQDPKWPTIDVGKKGKKKLKWPLSDMGTHYKMAAACKGTKLRDGEIEGKGAFGELLEELTEKYYMIRIDVSDNGKYNNLQWPPTILPCEDQTKDTRQTKLADDELPEGL